MSNNPITAEKIELNFYKIYKVFDKSTGKYLSSNQKNIWDGIGGVKQMLKARFYCYNMKRGKDSNIDIPETIFIHHFTSQGVWEFPARGLFPDKYTQ